MAGVGPPLSPDELEQLDAVSGYIAISLGSGRFGEVYVANLEYNQGELLAGKSSAAATSTVTPTTCTRQEPVSADPPGAVGDYQVAPSASGQAQHPGIRTASANQSAIAEQFITRHSLRRSQSQPTSVASNVQLSASAPEFVPRASKVQPEMQQQVTSNYPTLHSVSTEHKSGSYVHGILPGQTVTDHLGLVGSGGVVGVGGAGQASGSNWTWTPPARDERGYAVWSTAEDQLAQDPRGSSTAHEQYFTGQPTVQPAGPSLQHLTGQLPQMPVQFSYGVTQQVVASHHPSAMMPAMPSGGHSMVMAPHARDLTRYGSPQIVPGQADTGTTAGRGRKRRGRNRRQSSSASTDNAPGQLQHVPTGRGRAASATHWPVVPDLHSPAQGHQPAYINANPLLMVRHGFGAHNMFLAPPQFRHDFYNRTPALPQYSQDMPTAMPGMSYDEPDGSLLRPSSAHAVSPMFAVSPARFGTWPRSASRPRGPLTNMPAVAPPGQSLPMPRAAGNTAARFQSRRNFAHTATSFDQAQSASAYTIPPSSRKMPRAITGRPTDLQQSASASATDSNWSQVPLVQPGPQLMAVGAPTQRRGIWKEVLIRKRKHDVYSRQQVAALKRLVDCQYVRQMFQEFVLFDQHYIIFENPRLGTLNQITQRYTCLPEPIVVNVFLDLLEALHFLHGAKVLHRYVCHRSVTVASEGHVMLSDFKAAKAFSENNKVNEASHMYGEYDFTAPEILLGKKYSYSADWFSVGLVCGDMLGVLAPFIEVIHRDHDDVDYIFSEKTLRKIKMRVQKFAQYKWTVSQAYSKINDTLLDVLSGLCSVVPAQRPIPGSILDCCTEQLLQSIPRMKAFRYDWETTYKDFLQNQIAPPRGDHHNPSPPLSQGHPSVDSHHDDSDDRVVVVDGDSDNDDDDDDDDDDDESDRDGEDIVDSKDDDDDDDNDDNGGGGGGSGGTSASGRSGSSSSGGGGGGGNGEGANQGTEHHGNTSGGGVVEDMMSDDGGSQDIMDGTHPPYRINNSPRPTEGYRMTTLQPSPAGRGDSSPPGEQASGDRAGSRVRLPPFLSWLLERVWRSSGDGSRWQRSRGQDEDQLDRTVGPVHGPVENDFGPPSEYNLHRNGPLSGAEPRNGPPSKTEPRSRPPLQADSAEDELSLHSAEEQTDDFDSHDLDIHDLDATDQEDSDQEPRPAHVPTTSTGRAESVAREAADSGPREASMGRPTVRQSRKSGCCPPVNRLIQLFSHRRS